MAVKGTLVKTLEFDEVATGKAQIQACAPMCGPVRKTDRRADTMSVNFFGGPGGQGARVWSAGKSVTDEHDREQLRARVRELEALCTDVLIAGVDIGLPQHLLNQL